MKISFGLLATASLLFSLMPVRAETIYPTSRWCRVYDDTAFIGIPDQCGTVVRSYPRKLFVRASRKLTYQHYPDYYYCP
jgi:hypothetical protein